MFEQFESILKFSEGLKEIFAIIVSVVVFLFAYAAIFILVYVLNKKIWDIIKSAKSNLDDCENKYLKVLCVVAMLSIIILFNMTNSFYLPTQNGYVREYDVVYTADTGSHLWDNVWMNISAAENDIRQPLFGVFAIPFAVIPFIISKVLFFIPNCYAILMALIQVLLLGYISVLIARLLKINSLEKTLFFILCTFTYPFVLFALNMEQYVFATFWLVLFIYDVLTDRKNIELLYVASTGSMLTSGVFFYLLSESKKIKEWIKDIFKVAIKFLMISVVAGQFIIFVQLIPSLNALSRFSGTEILFYEKVLQFFNFVSSCFFAPKTIIDTMNFNHISWQLAPVETINIFGIVLLVLVLLGFMLNRKDKFAQICMMWVIFSFVILCLIGWGTQENGLILYTLYFSWAYVSLVILFLRKILKNDKFRNFTYLIFITMMVTINIPAIYDLIKFGLEYYPVVR